ncbi:MAG: carboxypeptidase-like regulatory domain-containing protein, partial [Tannerella sp.]|nr:carboxypeptidase-like regulatory domain-containing protein [Tannerella sp.]
MAKLTGLVGTSKKFVSFFYPFFIVCALSVEAQTLNGIALDSRTNEPVIGASVLIKGGATGSGTVTDIDGGFTLEVIELPVVIVVSYMGYKPQEIDIYEIPESLTVHLSEDLNLLNEIVVIGYGTVKKSDLTGAVSSIKESDFNKGVSASVDQLLQGTTPGLNIQQSSS